MRRFGLLVITCAALFALATAAPVRAGHYSATFTGVVTNFTMAGFCNTDPSDFSNQCPSGNCDCIELQGTVTGNIIGHTARGAVQVNITYDQGASQVGWAGEANCGPIYGAARITGNRDVEEIDFTGSMCLIVDTGFKPQTAPLAGNWGLTDISGIHKGFGTVRGAINLSDFTAKQSLTFTGDIGQ